MPPCLSNGKHNSYFQDLVLKVKINRTQQILELKPIFHLLPPPPNPIAGSAASLDYLRLKSCRFLYPFIPLYIKTNMEANF